MSTKESHGKVSGQGRPLSYDTTALTGRLRNDAVKKELRKIGVNPKALEIVQVPNPVVDSDKEKK